MCYLLRIQGSPIDNLILLTHFVSRCVTKFHTFECIPLWGRVPLLQQIGTLLWDGEEVWSSITDDSRDKWEEASTSSQRGKPVNEVSRILTSKSGWWKEAQPRGHNVQKGSGNMWLSFERATTKFSQIFPTKWILSAFHTTYSSIWMFFKNWLLLNTESALFNYQNNFSFVTNGGPDFDVFHRTQWGGGRGGAWHLCLTPTPIPSFLDWFKVIFCIGL